MNRLADMLILVVILALWGRVPAAYPQTLPVTFQGSGASSFDGWESLTTANFSSGYGSFPGFSPWTKTMGSNVNGSADAELSRLVGSSTGGPFPAQDSVYFGSTNQLANAFGGTLEVNETSPVSGLKTIVFQIQIGEALGYDFFSPSGAPVLKINNTTNRIEANYPRYLVARFQNETFPIPETELDEPVYVNTWAFQWNLAEGTTVTSFQIEFSAVTHAQIYELQLDQAAEAYSTQIIPAAPTGPPRLGISSIGAPQFHSSSNITTIQHVMTGPANRTLDIEHSTDLFNETWAVQTNVPTGSGSFTNTVSAAGDQRASWSQRMFFRAKYSQAP